MKILAIDQSFTCTGINYFVNDKLVYFTAIKSDKKQDIFTRASYIVTEIFKIYDNYKPNVFCIEGLAFGATGNATRDLAGLLFSIITYGIHNYSDFKYEIVRQVKTLAIGKGKASKNEMIEALPNDIKELFMSENYKKTTGLADLADAYFIGKHVYNNNKN